MKKILIITPRFPFPETGACEQDRAAGIKDFIRYGYTVRVITKVPKDRCEHAIRVGKELGIKVMPVSYKFSSDLTRIDKIRRYAKRIINPFFWDGAAYEYFDPEIQDVVRKEIDTFTPDVVWFDYTYLWPLYHLAKRKNTFIATRSENFEPNHFWEEAGLSFMNLLKYLPKLLSEYLVTKKSDALFSITPKEENMYRKLGAKKVANLPLRGLPSLMEDKKKFIPKDRDKVCFFFMGSSYNIPHNRQALEFIVDEIVPQFEERNIPFLFYILGGKVPEDIKKKTKSSNIVYKGYVEDIDGFLNENIDIAVIPSLFGAGMQQKIFEPITRGIPTICSKRGIAAYNIRDQHEAILCDSLNEFVDAMVQLQDIGERRRISQNALAKSKDLFSQEKIDTIVRNNLP